MRQGSPGETAARHHGGVDGVLLIDKPAAMTSHDVVAAVRRSLHGVRTGHAGTLDPFATGLLLVLVGRATRVQSLLMGLPKRYETVARLGALSSTGDPEGEIVLTGRHPADPVALPTGRLRQRPPAHSAIHVAGERAYRRARRGETVSIPERDICVHRFDQLWRAGDRAAFAIECSSGTYVRSLVADLGDAYCLELRRTAIGDFSVADAAPPPTTAADTPAEPMSIARALAFLPRLRLDGEAARVAAHGVAVAPARGTWERRQGDGDEPVLLVDDQGALAVADARRRGGPLELKPRVGLRG